MVGVVELRQARIGRREVRHLGDDLAEQASRLLPVVRIEAQEGGLAEQPQIVGLQVPRGTVRDRHHAFRGQVHVERGGNAAHDVLLSGKPIGGRNVEAFAPEIGAGRHIPKCNDQPQRTVVGCGRAGFDKVFCTVCRGCSGTRRRQDPIAYHPLAKANETGDQFATKAMQQIATSALTADPSKPAIETISVGQIPRSRSFGARIAGGLATLEVDGAAAMSRRVAAGSASSCQA